MQIKLDKSKQKTGVRTQIRIAEAYRPQPGATPRQRTVESLGFLEDKENPTLFLEELLKKVAAMNQAKSLTLNLNFAMKNMDERNISKNYGYMFVEKMGHPACPFPVFVPYFGLTQFLSF